MLDSFLLVVRLVRSGLAESSAIQGCTAEEIQSLESSLGVRLPRSYAQFLKAVGKCAGRFWDDIDFEYEKLPHLQTEAVDILNDCEVGRLVLPPNAFVCGVRRGEQFLFFEADGQRDDPPIYRYMVYQDHRGRFDRIAESFWEVVEDELELFEEWNRTIRGSPE